MDLTTKDSRIATRKALADRYGSKCLYCGKEDYYKNFTIEHVIPRVRGGNDTEENLRLACEPCNKAKAWRKPEEYRKYSTLKLQEWAMEWRF